jgi:membrane fusion protein, multidrug efflux system
MFSPAIPCGAPPFCAPDKPPGPLFPVERTWVAFAAAAMLAACTPPAENVKPPRPALVFTIGPGGGTDADVYPGEIRARHESDHAFRIGGKIVSRLVDQGARVARGQALAKLDPLDTKLGADAAQASVAAAETEATFAEAEYKRFKDLFNKGFVSQSALDQKLNVANAARARLESARAQANVSQNQAGYSTLFAEFDGIVTQVFAETGQVVGAGQTVLRVANPADKELLIWAPESKIGDFRSHGKPSLIRDVRVATTSNPTRYYAAKVREIAGAADPVTRTYPIRISLIRPDESVQLGMSGFAVTASATQADRISVPLSAVLVKGNASAVFRIGAGGKLSLVPVEVVQFTETAALVRGPLQRGDTIVAAGVHKLREGEVVKPLADPRVTGDGKVARIADEPDAARAAALGAVPPITFR